MLTAQDFKGVYGILPTPERASDHRALAHLHRVPPVITHVGDAVMVPAGIAHGLRSVSDKRASYVVAASPGPYEKHRVERPAERNEA